MVDFFISSQRNIIGYDADDVCFYVIIRCIDPSRLILITSEVWFYVIGRGIYKV